MVFWWVNDWRERNLENLSDFQLNAFDDLSFYHQNNTHTHTGREKGVTYAICLDKITFYPSALGRFHGEKLPIMTSKHRAPCNSKKYACQHIIKVPLEQIICAWLVMLLQMPTLENTTKQIKLYVLNMMSLSLFALINIYK